MIRAQLFVKSGRVLAIGVAMAVACAGGSLAGAQEATPGAFPASEAEAVLVNGAGEEVGTATVSESGGVVIISISVEGLPPGEHAVHLHNPGVCESEDGEVFRSTGGPADPLHGPIHNDLGTPIGAAPAEGVIVPHAGDFGNIAVADDGMGTFEVTTDQLMELLGTDHTLADADGITLAIHELPDDLSVPPSDAPSGASGPHIACGVIHPPAEGTPVATPAA